MISTTTHHDPAARPGGASRPGAWRPGMEQAAAPFATRTRDVSKCTSFVAGLLASDLVSFDDKAVIVNPIHATTRRGAPPP